VLAFEQGGYGSRINIRPFYVMLNGEWTIDYSEKEVGE